VMRIVFTAKVLPRSFHICCPFRNPLEGLIPEVFVLWVFEFYLAGRRGRM